MEIVIDIDNEDYKRIQDIPDVFNSLTSRTYSAIRNGTPLPEHHGRLKDVDWIDENCNHHYSERDGSWCYTWRDIDNAPTIIEGSESE